MIQGSLTPSTLAVTVVPASPSVVGNGYEFGADCNVEGPRPLPLTINIAPCAIPELGNDGGSQLAALMTPLIDGAAANVAALAKARTARLSSRMGIPRSESISSGREAQSRSVPLRFTSESQCPPGSERFAIGLKQPRGYAPSPSLC